MDRILIDFSTSKYSDTGLVKFWRGVLLKMTGNTYFPNPAPTLTEVDNSFKLFEESITKATDGSKADTEFKNRNRKTSVDYLKKLAQYVEGVAQGDRLIMLSSGFKVSSPRGSISELDFPENVKLIPEGRGRLLISCEKIEHARFYEAQYTATPVTNNSILVLATSTKSQVSIKDLESGREMAVRISGVAATADRSWSEWHTSFVL